MFSVASLLNPVNPESQSIRQPLSPSPSLHTSSSARGSPQMSTQPMIRKPKMTKDGAIFAKGKIKGEVKYPPYQNLDQAATAELQKYRVYPMGNIEQFCRHIPYNSEKKDFLEKTGRESFEVFQYVFMLPGDEKEYTVMWDYNIGLVRITPFFKCLKYSKTMPAKMLNSNPGLKEITNSITGGALAAQGYWMPYTAALAVCATFCSSIAGALIPLFGPSFPSLCVPEEAPEYKRMIIDPAIVVQATAEAESYRVRSAMMTPKSNRDSYSPEHRSLGPVSMRATPPPNNLERRLRLKRTFGGDSPYGTPTDTDADGNASETSSGDGYYCSPVTPVSANSLHIPQTWRSNNMLSQATNSSVNILHPLKPAPGPDPLLSAIPRSSCMINVRMSNPWTAIKRRVEEVDADDEMEPDDCVSLTEDKIDDKPVVSQSEVVCANDGGGVEQKAALLLMKLNVRDGEYGSEIAGKEDDSSFYQPRIKRRRATSM